MKCEPISIVRQKNKAQKKLGRIEANEVSNGRQLRQMNAYSLRHKSISQFPASNSYAIKGFVSTNRTTNCIYTITSLVIKAESVRIT